MDVWIVMLTTSLRFSPQNQNLLVTATSMPFIVSSDSGYWMPQLMVTCTGRVVGRMKNCSHQSIVACVLADKNKSSVLLWDYSNNDGS